MEKSYEIVRKRENCIDDRLIRLSRVVHFSREPVKIATLQDSGAMQRCLASLYYPYGKSGVNKKEGVFIWCH
jgi:ribose 1,5-bisphosphokinase PhnN